MGGFPVAPPSTSGSVWHSEGKGPAAPGVRSHCPLPAHMLAPHGLGQTPAPRGPGAGRLRPKHPLLQTLPSHHLSGPWVSGLPGSGPWPSLFLYVDGEGTGCHWQCMQSSRNAS